MVDLVSKCRFCGRKISQEGTFKAFTEIIRKPTPVGGLVISHIRQVASGEGY